MARRLADQGSLTEAVVQAKAAAGIYRQLALADPGAYLPCLVRALTEVGGLWLEVDWEKAVAPTQEATYLYRHLTQDAFLLPDVAGSLSSLLKFLWEASVISQCQIINIPSAPSCDLSAP